MDKGLITTLIIQGVALLSTYIVSRKDTSAARENIDVASDNAMLKMELKRICNAIYDDVPYAKLKEIAQDIEENMRI